MPHKESIHITTPSTTDFRKPFPREVDDWITMWDDVSVELMQVMAGMRREGGERGRERGEERRKGVMLMNI